MEDVHGSDSAMQAYYRILNTRFRLGLAASTDYSCNYGEPYGTLLTYVSIPDGNLTYRKWIEGIAKGRTAVSRNAHNEFLDVRVNGAATAGDEVRLSAAGPVRVRIEWRSLAGAGGTAKRAHDDAAGASPPGTGAPRAAAACGQTV